MTVPVDAVDGLSRSEKQELLRKILIERISRTRTAPISFAQERLWFLHRLEPHSPSYNVPDARRLSGPLDVPALERALGEVVRRHDALRTTFAEADEGPVQVIAPFTGFVLPVEDLSALDGEAREAEVRRLAAEDALRPFDLADGPLFRARLLRLGDAEHVLLLCMHHVVTDGWSLGVLFRELSALYGAYREGRESPLAELAVQYADVAARQRQAMRGEALKRRLAWWKERLAGAPALLELPADRPRPAARTHAGARERMDLSGALVDPLRALAQREGATLFMVALAAFQVLLSKYSGSEDVVVGSPVAGRMDRDEEALIGFFVNTVALRTDLGGDPPFDEVLRRVRAVTLGALDHQDVPFDHLVAELAPERSLGHSPLFQVTFALQNEDDAPEELAGLTSRRLDPVGGTSKFDLTLAMEVRPAGIHAELEYSTDLFERGTIRRMLRHLGRVLEQAAADPGLRLSRLELVDDEERGALLRAWEGSETPYPRDASIPRLFEEQAARAPHAEALVFGGESLMYGQLNERADGLARRLARLGVGAEARVGICLPRGAEMAVSLLAVLKAGGAYVPLDPDYPPERLAFMLADSGVVVLLTDETLRARIPARSGVRVLLAGGPGEEMETDAGDPLPAVRADSLAYVIYTSGSTGTPKGVAVTHRGAVRLVRETDFVTLGAGDRIAQTSNASFDAAIFEVWGALLNGGTLVGIPRDAVLAPAELAAAFRAHRVTTAFLTTALFHQVAGELPGAFSGLRDLVVGGDAMDPAAARRVLQAGGPRRLVNGYGPTENTTFSSWHRVADVPDGARSVPIGRAIAHSSLRVLDAALRPVPSGVPGELYVGGDGLARGYLGRPALTAERFVPDPFAAAPGARMYRTGDRVRWTECERARVRACENGETHALTHSRTHALEFLARLDGQVKIRGFRVEPGEIEAALRRHPAVEDCAVVARRDAGEARLVAYVAGTAGADELRAHVRASLPDYMVPAAFVRLDRLPLTPNGKLDRKALPAPDEASSGDDDGHTAPRTPVEEVLAGIFSAVLGMDRVGIRDSFFDLGGHSLLATRVASRIREAFGIELPLRALFEAPAVAELAERVESLRRLDLPSLPPIVPVDRSAPPLSFAQERLWLVDRMEPGRSIYNVPAGLRLQGALDAAALERALGEIIRRHEALRTTFAEADGQRVQVIAPFRGFVLPVEDLSALDEAEREAEARRRAREDAVQPFDLAAGPLFRAALLRLDAEEHVLLLCMHHVVSDGWSMGVLFRELSALYGAYTAGRESPLAELAVQYADFAVWQRRHLTDNALRPHLDWWKERLAGAPALLELPTDRPRPAVETHRGAHERIELPRELLDGLRALGRGEGATLYMVLLGAFQVLLSKYGAGDDVVVGSPIAGRSRGEVEGLIGFFVNTLVLRTDLAGDPAFREVLRRVRHATLGAYEHQDLPFERLVAELRPERSLGHAPLFQVTFALHDDGALPAGDWPGLRTADASAELNSAKFDLSLTLSAGERGLGAVMSYATDLFDRATIVRMLGHLRRLLEQAAGDPGLRLSRLSLVDDDERRALLQAARGAEAASSAVSSIPRMFEAAAARAPHAPALVDDGQTLAYGEMNARANRLARRLARLGAGSEACVAIVAGRGIAQTTAALAVMKTGAAYLPIDPAYPAKRIAFLLRDSGARVVLAEARLAGDLDLAVPVLALEHDAAWADESADNLDLDVAPANAAYVIYTSGSTGRPKGVTVEHRALANLVRWFRRVYELGPADRGSLIAGPGFDATVYETWPFLSCGASLRVFGDDVRTSADALREIVLRDRVTVLWLPTPLVEGFLALDWPADAPLRVLSTGGDTLRARPAPRHPFVLFNCYGPTENTVASTFAHVAPGGDALPTIGRAVDGTRVYLLDSALQPVPVGVPGEMFLAGASLARGYLRRPGITAERFIPDPFATTPGARMYATGDRAKRRADGEIGFLGRTDFQVKVRGFRIEPGEVEAALSALPGVGEAVVLARGEGEQKRLVAWVSGADVTPARLRDALRERLPEWMVPSAIIVLDRLPLNANGKLDRDALPAPEEAAGDEDRHDAPRTPVEEVLAGIYASVLERERVGIRDGFFELGGHSLLATLVMSRVRDAFGVELPLRVLFQAPTVAQLAERVEALRRRGLPSLPPVAPAEHAGAAPLSFAQERLWLVDRLEPGRSIYNVPAWLRLEGALDARALERALGEIVRRHDALRTTFSEADGRAVQVIAPFRGFSLAVEDLSALDAAEREAEAMRRAREDAMRPFDLAAGPLFRARLLRLGAADHLLLLCMHHVVSDGWSMGVLFRELSALYGAYREGRESPLAQPGLQYADFAVWQRTHLTDDALRPHLEWWTERMAGAPALLELPTDRPRPPVETHRGAYEGIELPRELLDALRALGRGEGATLYMVLLGAFQLLLSKYGAGDDVVVGSPAAGRSRAEVEGLIGFFVNTLVLRTDLSGDPAFRQLLRRVREATLGAHEHQELPFERLVAELRPERSLGHAPLFQVLFAVNDSASSASEWAGLRTRNAGAELDSAKFDLSLSLSADEAGFRGVMSYATDLFDRGTIIRMLGHLRRVLEQAAADPDRRLSQIDLLDDAERRRVVEEWNRTEAEGPADRCVHHLFQAQAARTPDAAALVFEDETVSYGALDRQANRVARVLRGRGIGVEDRVALCLEPGPAAVAAVLGVLKAGAAFVPLDVSAPRERMEWVADDADVRLVLAQSETAGALAGIGRDVVRVDDVDPAVSGEPVESGAGPASAAYVIYTSGSTGRPKGVVIEHRSAVNMTCASIALASFGPGSRAILFAPLHFDAALADLFPTLCSGATLCLAPRDALLPGPGLVELLDRHQVTHAKLTPSALAAVPRAPLPALRVVTVGGEACPRELVDAWAPGRTFLNVYGPTETTVRVTATECAPGAIPSIGRPIANTRTYVLDATMRPVPAGVPGELYVGGVQVARGYLGQPGLTAERFVPDPFAAAPGARMYATGDRARWREESAGVRECVSAEVNPGPADSRTDALTHSRTAVLEYLGRLDEQVKIRGFRIEPGEVEAALRGAPGVADCAVVARQDVPGDTRLVGYVAGAADFDTLRTHLRRTLPEYMVPSAFVALDRLPLNRSGKLDRKALPAPALEPADDAPAPRTPEEEVLAGIWAEVLRVKRVGTRDNFFSLGGHSLSATLVMARVQEVFGVQVPLRALFEHPTVEELAARVEEMRRDGLAPPPPIVPIDRDRPLPLSFAQERLWLIHRLDPQSALYNVPAALRLSGALDVAALERAVGEIIRRHEVLRTTFREMDGAPVQVIAPFHGFALPVEEVAGSDREAREAALRSRMMDEAARPFDLEAGPLFRPALLQLEDAEHVLLMPMHHVASDEWSTGVLTGELASLYAAYREGRPSPLADPPVQYADFAAWQREQLAGEALDRELAWWRARMDGAPAVLELPTDRPRPAVATHRGAFESAALPPALLERLEVLARAEGVTLFMVLLGAFQVLLAKYSGSDDVVVGSPVSGRTRREVEGVIGFFLNTLVLRTELGGDPTFRDVLRRVRQATLGAYDHQEVPFDRLVAELRPGRSLGHAPLFQVMFVLQAADRAGDAQLPGVRMERLGVGTGTSKFDLLLGAAPRPDGLGLGMEYSTDLFDRGTIARMLRHLERVLEQAVDAPGARLSELDLLAGEERRQVIEGWNRTDAAYPAECVHHLVQAQAARTPDAAAVELDGVSLTYRELDARANRLARHLVRLAVGPEVRVGVCLERGVEMIVSVLAVLKAGGAYVPLDPAYPAPRLRFMMEDAAAPVLITQGSLRSALPELDGVRVVTVDGSRDEIAAESSDPPPSAAGPGNAAYVLYTSGSTGQPKGVVMPHAALANLLRWHLADGPCAAPRRTLQFASLSFDVSFQEIAVTLASGGTLVLVRDDVRRDPPALVRLLSRERIERLFLPFVALQAVAEAARDADLPFALREIVTAGEQLVATPQVAALVDGCAGCRLINHYGPTETHVATAHTLAAESAAWPALPPIGGPVANTRIYVLDAAMRPLPAGVPGDLYIGGLQLARGYLNRPALTAERFLPDPFSAAPGARLYATGDRARWMETECESAKVRECGSGNTHALPHSRTPALHYLGRRDLQVKIRGFRVEPGEVEWALRRCDGVRDCAVVAREDEPGRRRLVAYVVGDADADALRTHLRQALPEHMVPSAFVILDALPLTPSGKVDRKALPAPEPSADAESAGARTPVEEVLAGIWAEVLRLERVGIGQDFFDLGGHSLLATRVVSRIREVLGVEMPLRALFESPTVAELAVRVEALRRADHPALPPIVPIDRSRALPLSFAQERLWFLDRLQPGSAFYNLPVALRLTGALDRPALERALGEIVRRHESLRTTFGEIDGQPVQVIAPFDGFALPIEDVSEDAMRRRAEEEAARPFDLAAGPLFRATLLRVDDEHVLLLSMHHVVSDGWSLGVLFRELAALYKTYKNGEESQLPPLSVQYADHAAWQRAHHGGEAMDRQLAWWMERLAGAPALLELPTDRPRPAAQSHRGAREPVQLSAELLRRLEAVARREGATVYMVLLGAFQVLLSKYAGTDDVVVGSPIAGRTRGETEGLIGFFVNTLVLRTDLSGAPSFRDVLRRVRQTTLGAYEHQDVPFERLVAELRPERSLGWSPLVQVMLTLQNTDLAGGDLPGLRVGGVDAELQTARVDLALTLAAHPDGIRGGMQYATDLFDRATIVRMLAHLERVLDSVAADPDRSIAEIGLLGDAERRQVIDEWNRTEAVDDDGPCIHQRIEAQAARTPDAAAVAFGADALSYRELDDRANRIARSLRRRGVGPEVRVAVLLERSAELIAATLGVMKAGGAFVPLDPAYPAERLEQIVRDAGVGLLLTRTALRDRLAADGVDVVAVDGDEVAAESAERIDSGATARTLAYVVYTSGSTGTPKGVAVEHRGLANMCAWHADAFSVTPEDRATQLISPGFDAWASEVWPYLARGACVQVVPEDVRTDPGAFRDWIVRHRTTIATAPAALAEPMLALDWPRTAALRSLITGGDRLRVRPGAHLPFSLANHYGPTECTVTATSAKVDVEDERAPSIGRPVWNTRAYVLDASLRPVPAGIPGELYVGGVQVARGYLGDAARTAERFLPDPFAAAPGARMYRTGDRVRWIERTPALTHSRTDALTHSRTPALDFLGRVDAQLKIRGFRVEPGDIEAALRRDPSVAGCAVVAREGADGGRRLVAYVVGDVDTDALRTALKRSLPEYMVPGSIVILTALPLTPNGKVDRRALPAPEDVGDDDRHAPPRTPVEEVIAGIWRDVLAVDCVGARDDFFALGGHSLLATRVVARIREVFAVDLPLRALFESPTVAALATEVEALRRTDGPVPPPIVAIHRSGPPPLSFAQERLWFLHRLQPESPRYNLPAALRLSGALDAAALERALGEIIRRHESLRTTFAEADNGPVQVIAPFTGFALAMEDLSALDDEAREQAVRRMASEDAARPFDLAAGPLFRARLLRVADHEHVLLLAMHHVVADGWSMGVLYRELAALYKTYKTGAEAQLPPVKVQYADYAVWQRARLDGQVLERELAYWTERLAGAPELLALPADFPRPAVQSHRGAHQAVRLSSALRERLEALGRREGATLYMVLLAAFQLLLSRHGAGDDVVVGSPVAGRTRAETEGLIGFFVNTLVLRTDLSGTPSFRGLLRRVRETTLGAYEHQDVPFERLVEALAPERSLSHSPLFQVLFTLENAPQAMGGSLPGLRVSGVAADSATAKFDLSLTLGAGEDGVHGALTYSTDLFERATIARMAERLTRLLDQVADDPDLPISRLELLGEEERDLVIGEWNRTDPGPVADECIHALVEARAAGTPHAVAAIQEDRSLTFAALNAEANRVAHHLRRLGVGPEARVGICLERGVELIVCALGVLKAGGAYVALDPAHPAERLASMLADSGAAVLVTMDAMRAAIPVPAGVRVVCIDRESPQIAAESAENPGIPVDPGALAYVIYTSGSTGTPKGVAVEHRALRNLCAWHVQAFGVTADDRATQLASPGFDAWGWEVWPYLAAGACVEVVPDDVRADAEGLRDWLVRRGSTMAFVPTPVAEPMLSLAWPADTRLRWLLAGGDRLRARPADGLPFAFSNNYGPTECTVVATSGRVGADGARAPSIGGPIGNTRVYVLAADLRPLPIGVPGELYVGGAQVARGYLEQPALTAARFIPDPFGPAGARMYATGDRVRWIETECESGCADASPESTTFALSHSRTFALDFLGRADAQVKVRGFRIEPGEIEAALRRHPGVRDCAVVPREDAPGETRLVAYIAGDADVEAVRAHLRGILPEYMVPAAIVRLDALPLTPNGKLDRKALPAPDPAMSGEGWKAPRTVVEEVVVGIWAEVLRRDQIGIDQNFFDLGGHSLLATRVVSRIREVLGVELPLRTLFEGPTVAEIAMAVEALRRAGRPPLPPVVAVPREGPLPLSFAQERLWFLDRMAPESAFYNVPAALRLRGALDVAALERALGEIIRRHESLRTTFREVDGRPAQVIAPFRGFHLRIEDLSALGDAPREAEVRRLASAEAARPFDLAAGPLFRATLLRLGDDEHVLLLGMHHIVADGWSAGVLLSELAALYRTYKNGEESQLAPLSVQYADFAVWQRAQLDGEAMAGLIAYWRERLAGAPALLELPTDRPRPPVQTHRGARERVELPAELLRDLQALARREGATLYMVLLGAFQVLLGRYAASDDVVIGSPIAGRTRREAEGLIGFFVNTLVLRTDLGGDPAFREVLRRVRQTTLGAYEHQDVPFEKLVDALQPERSLSYSPLFQAMFALQDSSGAGDELPGLRMEAVESEPGTTKFDLTLSLAVHPGGLRGALEYGTDLFEAGAIRRMLGHLRCVLEQVIRDPGLRLSQLDLLGEAERGLLLDAGKGMETVDAADLRIHELFRAQAARTPDAEAIRFGGRGMTYRELDEASNRLAHHLAARGVRPATVVGIVAERAPETVAAILATLKAGGAYLPLDPAYPAERLRMMLADAGARTVIAPDGVPDALAGIVIDPLDLRAEAASIAARPAHPPRVAVSADALAYVIYTSGSTGQPKGVMVTHRGVPNLARAQIQRFGIDSSSRVLQFASFSFDAAVSELFTALLSGATLVLATREELLPGAGLIETLRRERISVATIPPSVLAVLPDDDLPHLRTLVTAGEAADAALVERWSAGRILINAYGPTETTVCPCCAVCQPDGRTPSIGQPIENVRLYVLDAAARPSPAGVPGELFVGGVGIARGYLGRPGQTAERFVPDPFGPAGARLYRTGDRVRWAERTDALTHSRTHALDFLGRVDAQVKVRGFRIEPGEIEAALRRHPAVRECAVVARHDPPGERRLVAYVAGPADAAALREHLRGTLPEHMVPGAFVVLDALPRTPAGKLDRGALPAPERAGRGASPPPRNAMEARVAEVWREVLDVAEIGVEDNFFDLGGSSLLLYRVYARLREVRADLRVVDLFRYATVEALARWLGAGAAEEESRADQLRARAEERGAARRRVRR